MADILVLDHVKEFTCLIPRTHETMCNQLGLDRVGFEQFAVCPECHTTYPKSDVTSGRISRCTFIKWPHHPHRALRAPCNTLLHTGSQSVPKGIFCFRPVSKYIQDFVIQKDFLARCNAWRNRTIREGYMADVYDGSHWKQELGAYLAEPTHLYGLINLDWFNPYKHTQHSVGAIYIVILNLPRAERFKENNVILAGILPGPSEPKLTANTYLAHIVEDLKLLEGGIDMVDSTQEGEHTYRFRIMGCASDLPATRKLGGFLSFAAKNGCSKCLKEFPRILNDDGQSRTDYSGFVRDQWVPRNAADHKRCASLAREAVHDTERQRLESSGARWSDLFSLTYFDPIAHHTIDPMHCLYLGIAKTMTKHYLKSGLIDQPGINRLQNSMDSVRVPNNIGRIPRKIASGFASFTADQWKNWTLVFSSTSLKPVLGVQHYNLWMKLVHAVSLFTKKIISTNDLALADNLLVSFCTGVERLYGADFIKPNFHMACHLANVMREYGPVYSFWCFSFERYNGLLGDYNVNNHEVSVQMTRKFLMGQELERLAWPEITSNAIKDLLRDNETRGTISTVGNDITEHARLALADSFNNDNGFAIDTSGDGPVSFSCAKAKEEYMRTEDYETFKHLYSLIFPAGPPNLHRMVTIVPDLSYEGESFQPDKAGRVSCNIIRARWLRADHSLSIDPAERMARAGSVQRIIVTNHTDREGAKGSVVWLEMTWFSMHDQPYAFGNHVQIYHKSHVAPGLYSFVPIQRVISKCALKVAKHQHVDVYVTIPIAGQWAL